jgi:phytoene synthase
MIDRELLKRAKAITRQYGRGFYRSSFLFPKKVREATWVFYAFVRLPDEMVDSQKDKEKGLQDLNKWSNDWKAVIDNKPNDNTDPLIFATKKIFDFYHIPYEYVNDFLFAMYQDFNKTRYISYKELEEYMYGSAAVIGLVMSHIIGFKQGALEHAKALGEAFQLINFIRDAKEDYEVRGRVYLPKEDMDKFGVTENHIASGLVDDAWRIFIKSESDRAQALLDKGIKGIPMLNPKGRSAIYAAALIYGKILKEFEKTNYDTLSKRIVISPLQKTMLLFKAVWNKNQ